MADVRAMLRQERAARQQTQKTSATPAAAPSSKKRKAPDYAVEERKRTRTAETETVPSNFFDGGISNTEDATSASTGAVVAEEDVIQTRGGQVAPQAETVQPSSQDAAEVDEAELEAFIKEIEAAPEPRPGIYDRYAGAVVEAAPMTAAELAAQAKEEQSAERGRKEEEMEAEREEAERNLADEFEDMERLEQRVRKLREKREVLRKARASARAEASLPVPAPEPTAKEEEEESESDNEDFDDMDWRFRAA